MHNKPHIRLFTDGGVRRWTQQSKVVSSSAFIVVDSENNELYAAKKAWEFKTNNQMELSAMYMAMIYVYERIDSYTNVEFVSDSQYVVRGLKEWCQGWERFGWVTKEGKPVKNKELWDALWGVYNLLGKPQVIHTKGHANDQFNNRADFLVNEAMDEKEIELYGDTYRNLKKKGLV